MSSFYFTGFARFPRQVRTIIQLMMMTYRAKSQISTLPLVSQCKALFSAKKQGIYACQKLNKVIFMFSRHKNRTILVLVDWIRTRYMHQPLVHELLILDLRPCLNSFRLDFRIGILHSSIFELLKKKLKRRKKYLSMKAIVVRLKPEISQQV